MTLALLAATAALPLALLADAAPPHSAACDVPAICPDRGPDAVIKPSRRNLYPKRRNAMTRHQPSDHRRSSRLKRTASCLAAAITLAVGAGVLLPASAAYAADTLTCTGTSHLAYSPGLTYTPQTVTITETDTYSSCLSSDPTLTSGSISGSFPEAGLSCVDITAGPDTYRVNWNNGQHSSISFAEFEATITDGIQQYVGTGTVVRGEFAGDTAVFTFLYPLVNPLDCLAPGGLTSQDGTVIGDITGL